MYALPQPDLPDFAALERMQARGDAVALARNRTPRTIDEILQAASARMDAEDQAEAYRNDPVTYMRARRLRTRLIDRLLHGREKQPWQG